MSSEPYLIAHVVNATSDPPMVEFEIAYSAPNDEWYTNDGQRIWPFWTQQIEHDPPAIPEGWLEHLQREADSFAGRQSTRRVNILSLIPQVPRATIRRRL